MMMGVNVGELWEREGKQEAWIMSLKTIRIPQPQDARRIVEGGGGSCQDREVSESLWQGGGGQVQPGVEERREIGGGGMA